MSKKAQIITHGSLQLVLLLLAVLISGETIPFPARGVTGDTFFLGMSVLIGNTLLYVSYNLLEMEDFGALGLLKKACTVVGYVLTIGGGALTSFIFAMDTLKMDMGKVAGCPWAYAFGGIYLIAAVISSVLYAFVDPDSTVYPFATVISLGISYVISLGFVFLGINVARFFMAMCPFILVIVVAGVAIFAIVHGGGEVKILKPGKTPTRTSPIKIPVDKRREDAGYFELKYQLREIQKKMPCISTGDRGSASVSVGCRVTQRCVEMFGAITYQTGNYSVEECAADFDMDYKLESLKTRIKYEVEDVFNKLRKEYTDYDEEWKVSVEVNGYIRPGY